MLEAGRVNKDDISKAKGLLAFLEEDLQRDLYVATFVLSFSDDMTVRLIRCVVVPVAWLSDIYVNPSNNANLQSSTYKDLSKAVARTNRAFVALLKAEMAVAAVKRANKLEE